MITEFIFYIFVFTPKSYKIEKLMQQATPKYVSIIN